MKLLLLSIFILSSVVSYSEEQNVEKTIPSGTVNEGGGEKTIKINHPNAAKGLIKIKKDGSYQYKVPLREKSQSTSINFSSISRPVIRNAAVSTPTTYASMYGNSLFSLTVNYEWMPFRKFGALGLVFEGGIGVSNGRGVFSDGYRAEEKYTLYTFPLGAFLKYRFEYVRRQWVVPYIMGGGTYYALAESRDDGKVLTAGAAAVGGGGGLQINVSRFDPESAFRLDREWGIADMWLNLELRALQGLKQSIDFTNVTVQAGITVDY